jgi:uncharacterized membrane protein
VSGAHLHPFRPINPGVGGESLEAKSRDLAIVAILAASYAALVNVLHPISFMQIQVRIANALIGLVPVLGLPAVYGLTLGVFLANLTSPLGWIDLVSPMFSFIGLLTIYKLRTNSVSLGLVIYTLILSLWVTFMLSYVGGLPYTWTFLYVFTGISIATVGLGYLVYKSVSTRYKGLREGNHERI